MNYFTFGRYGILQVRCEDSLSILDKKEMLLLDLFVPSGSQSEQKDI